MPAPAEQGTIENDGARLYWASFGSGAPVILLHGGAGNSEHWANQVPALAEHYRVIVMDARGHGRSTRDAQPFSYHRMAEDVLALMDQLKIGEASLVGWSDGGILGLDLAIHHPERVKKLVAFGANYNVSGMRGGGHNATFTAYFDRCAADYARLSATPKQFSAFVDALRPMWRTEPDFKAEELAKIRAATLIADGEHDEVIRAEHVQAMAKLIPGARLLFIPKTSHFALWQRPDVFNQALLDFLAEK
jgi:pimeloyl-ACP methyl ester carboxylesterase